MLLSMKKDLQIAVVTRRHAAFASNSFMYGVRVICMTDYVICTLLAVAKVGAAYWVGLFSRTKCVSHNVLSQCRYVQLHLPN